MGRARLTLKCKPNESLRKLSFKQRSKVLEKKVSEFSTLGDVAEAFLIVYDANGDPQPLTWPQNLTKVHSIIEKYECEKNVKPLEMFGLQDYFEKKKDLVEDEISKVRKEILKIKYPTWDPSFNNLGNQHLSNFIATLNTKIEACNQRINMLKTQNQVDVTTSLPKHDMDSQSQMPHLDPNLVQLMAKNNGVMESANQVDLPLDCPKQSDAAIDSTNQLGEPDWDSLLDVPIDWISELGVSENWTTQPHLDPDLMQLMTENDGVMESANQVDLPLDCPKQSDAAIDFTIQLGEPDWDSLLDVPIDWISELGMSENWTTQLGEVMDCATLPDESVLHNVSCQSQNVQQGAALQTLTPTMNGFQTCDYNNMLQAKFFNI